MAARSLSSLSLVLFVFTLLLFYPFTLVNASLLAVDKNGEIVWKVLSSEDQLALGVGEKSDLEVKEVAGYQATNQTILLKKENEKIVLDVGETRQLDVTNWNSDLIEIEERGSVKKITVLIKDGKFIINQSDVDAKTEYPVSINPKENILALVTSTGSTSLVVLPLEAAEIALRSKYVSKVTNRELEITEADLGVLTYKVSGEKEIKIFNLASLKIPVTTFISTTTGEILSVDQPKWLSILGFLFT